LEGFDHLVGSFFVADETSYSFISGLDRGGDTVTQLTHRLFHQSINAAPTKPPIPADRYGIHQAQSLMVFHTSLPHAEYHTGCNKRSPAGATQPHEHPQPE
jgi:hypothetical protein